MAISRQFEIVYMLINKKQLTTKELADHFEVSTRTILRDIDSIITAGIPITSNRGKGGGISIDSDYVFDKAVLSTEELNQIILALQSLTITESVEVKETLNKFKLLFSNMDVNWLEIDFSRWGSNRIDQEKFKLIKDGIVKNQIVNFSYYSSYGELTNRDVAPLKLVFKSKSWYLQGYCLKENDYRSFKINRIVNLQMKEEQFDSSKYTVPQFESDEIFSYINLVLKFDASVLYRVLDEFDYEKITENDDGTITVNVNLPHDNWIYSFLLSFGNKVEVLEPASVKSELVAMANSIIDSYNMT